MCDRAAVGLACAVGSFASFPTPCLESLPLFTTTSATWTQLSWGWHRQARVRQSWRPRHEALNQNCHPVVWVPQSFLPFLALSPVTQLAVQKYEELFPAFSDSRECKLMKVSVGSGCGMGREACIWVSARVTTKIAYRGCA